MAVTSIRPRGPGWTVLGEGDALGSELRREEGEDAK